MNDKKQPGWTPPPQEQNHQPGLERKMEPEPEPIDPKYKGSDKLVSKVALITGGDSGIGRAVAVAFAREGADVAISYLNEQDDANDTKQMVEKEGRNCILLPGDVGLEKTCQEIVQKTVSELGSLDILVNNAAEQHPTENIQEISTEQLERTFRTNIFSMFYLVKAALHHLKPGSTIINTTSVTAYRGSSHLLDYSSTKGAIVAFTRSLSQNLAPDIRVNAVAPGPIWTPLIPSTFPKNHVDQFGASEALERPGQPAEIAPCFVFLASKDSSYMTGQVLHPNGGEVING